MIELNELTTNEKLTLLLSLINTIIVVLGVYFAINNIKIISKTNHYSSVTRYLDEMGSTAADRLHLFRSFPENHADYSTLDSELIEKAERVIKTLNEVGLLIEQEMLSPEQVLSISHTVIIRCWYKLEKYIRYKESQIGGRYGRRIERIYLRACKFHDIRPHQRINKINIQGAADASYVIYETKFVTGWKKYFQLFVWRVKYIFHWY